MPNIEEVKKILYDPDNWEKHTPVTGEAYWIEDSCDIKGDKVAQQICQLFEAGVAAMLEALKGKGQYGHWCIEDGLISKDWLNDPFMPTGWVVLIPDEE